MSLVDRAKLDWQTITTDLSGFGVAMTLEAPDTTQLDIIGLATKHHIGIDPDTGVLLNTKNAHVSFSEQQLIDAAYPVRNTNGEVDLENHRVTWQDSTGTNVTYVIREWFPDETIGVIVCILGDFE